MDAVTSVPSGWQSTACYSFTLMTMLPTRSFSASTDHFLDGAWRSVASFLHGTTISLLASTGLRTSAPRLVFISAFFKRSSELLSWSASPSSTRAWSYSQCRDSGQPRPNPIRRRPSFVT